MIKYLRNVCFFSSSFFFFVIETPYNLQSHINTCYVAYNVKIIVFLVFFFSASFIPIYLRLMKNNAWYCIFRVMQRRKTSKQHNIHHTHTHGAHPFDILLLSWLGFMEICRIEFGNRTVQTYNGHSNLSGQLYLLLLPLFLSFFLPPTIIALKIVSANSRMSVIAAQIYMPKKKIGIKCLIDNIKTNTAIQQYSKINWID